MNRSLLAATWCFVLGSICLGAVPASQPAVSERAAKRAIQAAVDVSRDLATRADAAADPLVPSGACLGW